MTIPDGSETINVSSSHPVFETEVPRYKRRRIHSLQPTISESRDVLPRRVSSAHPSARPLASLSQGIEVMENRHDCNLLLERLERRNTRIVTMETNGKKLKKK